jgi:hypothetical protein
VAGLWAKKTAVRISRDGRQEFDWLRGQDLNLRSRVAGLRAKENGRPHFAGDGRQEFDWLRGQDLNLRSRLAGL